MDCSSIQPASDLQSRDSSTEDIVWIPAQTSRDPRLQSNEEMINELIEDPLGIPDQSLKDPRRP